jgi:hypothetical protein
MSTAGALAKYVGAPLAIAGGTYALTSPNRPEEESLNNKYRRARDSLLLAGGTLGGMLGYRGVGAFKPGSLFTPGARLRATGAALGAAGGAYVAGEHVLPAVMTYAYRSRRAAGLYPQGVDPETGMPIHVEQAHREQHPEAAQRRAWYGV